MDKINFLFVGCKKPPFTNLLLLFEFLWVRLWFLNAFVLFTFPVAVNLNLLEAELFVFNFGIQIPLLFN